MVTNMKDEVVLALILSTILLGGLICLSIGMIVSNIIPK
jgi:hypothetical protein